MVNTAAVRRSCHARIALFVIVCLVQVATAALGGGSQRVLQASTSRPGAQYSVDFYNPRFHGTSWDARPSWYGEPLNVIISGRSHPSILREDGLIRFAKQLGFEPECLNLHFGDPQYADLADGNGWLKQAFEIRQAYFPVFGTCFQSAVGGNHFRAWKQNGTLADSGAWFLAVSVEHNYRKNHMIQENGYDRGRDLLADSARKRHAGYVISVSYLSLIQPGRRFNHGIATDGQVAVIEVQLY